MHAQLVVTASRAPQRRVMDLLIAATAHAHDVALYPRGASDIAGLEDKIEITVV